MEEVLGRFSPEPSQRPAQMGGEHFASQQSPHAEYSNVESMGSPMGSSHVQLITGSPPTASPQRHFIEPLKDELQMIWLQKYHPWFPILHHTSVSLTFSEIVAVQSPLQKAITAVTIWDVPGISSEQKKFTSETIRQEVVIDAMESFDFRSIQALLILSILFWGEGKWHQYSSLIAISKRCVLQV